MTSGGISGSGGHWNGLNTNSKITHPDNIVAIIDCNNQIWLMGSGSIEVHYDSGDFAGGVWKRYESAILEIGCSARFSPAKHLNQVYWLGTNLDGTLGVFTNNGLAPQRISVRGIEQIIQEMSDYSDAIGQVFFEYGHAFYLLQFISGDRTLVYDITTGTWHERTFLDRPTGTTHRWHGSYCTTISGHVIWGDAFTDAVYQSSQETYANDDAAGAGVNYIKTIKTTPIGFNSGKYVRYCSLQVIFAQGVGLPVDTAEGVGVDPVALIAYSDDSGVSWTQEQDVKLGRQGEYAYRSRLTTLGASYNRVWRVTCTEPVRYLLIGMVADMRPMGR